MRRQASAMVVGLVSLLLNSCGGGTGHSDPSAISYTGKTIQCEISRPTFDYLLSQLNVVAPVCSVSHGGHVPVTAAPGAVLLTPFRMVEQLAQPPRQRQSTVALGDCGGKITYGNLTYQAGTVQGKVLLDNVCSVVEDEREYLKGEITFESSTTAAAGIFGFTTTGFTAAAPLISMTRVASDGTVAGSSLFSFDGLVFVPAAPRGAFSAAIGSYSVKSLLVKSLAGSGENTVMVSDAKVTRVQRADAIIEEHISARLYVDRLGYIDAATDPLHPILVQPDGTHQSGTLNLSGSNGSGATLTILTSQDPTFTAEVNGEPLPDTTVSCLKIPLQQRNRP